MKDMIVFCVVECDSSNSSHNDDMTSEDNYLSVINYCCVANENNTYGS